MNEQVQQITIAKACGWKQRERRHGVMCRWTSLDWVNPMSDWDDVPDYLHSHDAMHAAFATLTPTQQTQFVKELYGVLNHAADETLADFVHDPVEVCAVLLSATPAQWAEAFLRARDGWLDDSGTS